MKLSDWYNQTGANRNKSLLAFNHEGLISGDLQHSVRVSDFNQALRRFEAALKSGTLDPNDPAKALAKFSSEEVRHRKRDAAAYAGVHVVGVKRFIALKALKFIKFRPDIVGFDNLRVDAFYGELRKLIHSSLDPFKRRPDGNFRIDLKRSVDSKIQNLIEASKPNPSKLALKKTKTGTAPTGIGAPTTGLPWSPIWLTSSEELSRVAGSPPESDPGPIRSAYAAGLKQDLGLHNASENLTDRERSKSKAMYGIVILIEIDLTSKEPPTQPCMFSDGYHDLFVARISKNAPTGNNYDGMAGRTVRLRDLKCRGQKHCNSCSCGDPGLPEAVMPTANALRDGGTCEFFTMLFSDDLHYERPTCAMIEQKNAAR